MYGTVSMVGCGDGRCTTVMTMMDGDGRRWCDDGTTGRDDEFQFAVVRDDDDVRRCNDDVDDDGTVATVRVRMSDGAMTDDAGWSGDGTVVTVTVTVDDDVDDDDGCRR